MCAHVYTYTPFPAEVTTDGLPLPALQVSILSFIFEVLTACDHLFCEVLTTIIQSMLSCTVHPHVVHSLNLPQRLIAHNFLHIFVQPLMCILCSCSKMRLHFNTFLNSKLIICYIAKQRTAHRYCMVHKNH